jgi:hypothetical protein
MKIRVTGEWECFTCEEKHSNTLLYCPSCNISKKHSNNLFRDKFSMRKQYQERFEEKRELERNTHSISKLSFTKKERSIDNYNKDTKRGEQQ